jgi:hypothetical protein
LRKLVCARIFLCQKLLSGIQVRYDKDVRDMVCSKYPIADIRVVRNLDIVVDYKSYKNRNEFLD